MGDVIARADRRLTANPVSPPLPSPLLEVEITTFGWREVALTCRSCSTFTITGRVRVMEGFAGKSHMLRRGTLAPKEEVLLETHASKWFFFPGPVAWLFLLLIVDYAAASGVNRSLPSIPYITAWLRGVHVPFLAGTIGLSTALLIISLAVTAGVGLWLVARFFEWESDVYAVTNERLIKQHGIVTHDIKEIPVKQVHTVEVYQKRLSGRILRYGTLEIDSLANLSRSADVFQSGGYMGPQLIPISRDQGPYTSPRDRQVLDPYTNPREDLIDKVGVETWFSVPNPIRIQRLIETANEGPD